MQIMSFVEWQKKHNISAAIIRPDRHVYGSCDHHYNHSKDR